MSTTVVTFKKPLASSRHVTWWIKGAKILDILPRSGQYVLAFFIWRWIRLRDKLRCQELQNIWSECVALNTPTYTCMLRRQLSYYIVTVEPLGMLASAILA